MIILGRRIIETTLEDIPRASRACPGYLAMTKDEIAAYQRNDGPTFKRIVDLVRAEDMVHALLQLQKKPKRPTRTSPATRMAMLRVLDPGRPPHLVGFTNSTKIVIVLDATRSQAR